MQRLPVYIFLTANAISLIGNSITIIAVPWFVLETTGSAARMGLVGFFTALPAILAAFFGGTLVDRMGHKPMSIVADVASGITVALIPLLYSTIGLEFWELLVLVFCSALLDAPGGTARQALLPDVAMAAGMKLEQVNAAQQTVQRGAMLVGPALAGGLIAWLGSSQVLWLDAATFAISALLFAAAIPASKAKSAAGQSYLQQLREGLQFIQQDRLVLTLVLTVAITNFLDAPLFAVVLPVFANELFGSAAALGFLLSSFGGGAVLGAIAYGIWSERFPRRWTFIGAFILVGLPFWVLALSPPFPVALAVLFGAGVAAGPINPLLMTVAQERVPAALRGRVFGMTTAIALIAVPLGMVAAGYLVDYTGVSITLLAVAVCYLLVTVGQIANPALHAMEPERD